ASCGLATDEDSTSSSTAAATTGSEPSVTAAALDAPPSAAVAGDWEGALSLGQLEAGGGRGSAAVAAADGIGPSDLLGDEWFEFAQPSAPLASCRFGAVRASAVRTYVNGLTNESIGLRIDVYDTPADAADGLDRLLGPDFKPCAADSVEQMRASVLQLGVYDTVDADPSGTETASLLPEREATSRRYTLAASGPRTRLDFDIVSTSYVVGQALVGIEVALIDGDHEAITSRVASMVDWDDFEWTPDPELDATVDRLRSSILGPESPAPFYQLIQAGTLVASNDLECGGPPAGEAELNGPLWATAQGISAIGQTSLAYPDEATAAEALAGVAEVSTICVYEEIAGLLAGNVTYDSGTVEVVERDGREVVVVDIEMTQRLGGSNSIDVDAGYIVVFVRSRTDVLSFRFIGVRGDEPDLVQLVVDAAAQVEAGS
ncbi:MAG: hypothetical protein AAFN30_12000, partial [Actinomycetota bacterium]